MRQMARLLKGMIWALMHEYPFSSETKMMGHVLEPEGTPRLLISMSYDLLASQSVEVRKSCIAKNDKGAHKGAPQSVNKVRCVLIYRVSLRPSFLITGAVAFIGIILR